MLSLQAACIDFLAFIFICDACNNKAEVKVSTAMHVFWILTSEEWRPLITEINVGHMLHFQH